VTRGQIRLRHCPCPKLTVDSTLESPPCDPTAAAASSVRRFDIIAVPIVCSTSVSSGGSSSVVVCIAGGARCGASSGFTVSRPSCCPALLVTIHTPEGRKVVSVFLLLQHAVPVLVEHCEDFADERKSHSSSSLQRSKTTRHLIRGTLHTMCPRYDEIEREPACVIALSRGLREVCNRLQVRLLTSIAVARSACSDSRNTRSRSTSSVTTDSDCIRATCRTHVHSNQPSATLERSRFPTIVQF
jgi:hypothetical protein